MSKRLTSNWPVFAIRRFTNNEESYSVLQALVEALVSFRNRLVIILNDHAEHLEGTQGSGAPSSTPSALNQFYTDTAAKDGYISVGTSSSADWKKITP